VRFFRKALFVGIIAVSLSSTTADAATTPAKPLTRVQIAAGRYWYFHYAEEELNTINTDMTILSEDPPGTFYVTSDGAQLSIDAETFEHQFPAPNAAAQGHWLTMLRYFDAYGLYEETGKGNGMADISAYAQMNYVNAYLARLGIQIAHL
jgi:hypothetical protein